MRVELSSTTNTLSVPPFGISVFIVIDSTFSIAAFQ
jgi:hypothetical protein